jgi:DNA invertase Pin-like site-specific DNA recombinase
LIAKLDRFSRRVSFIANIMDQGIGLVAAEMPNATDFQLHIFAALAQEERRMISERTRLALAEAKKRGVRLGPNGARLARIHRAAALARAKLLAPIVLPLRSQGCSFSEIARRLNALGLSSARGGMFYPEQVRAVIRRLSDSEEGEN